MLEQSQAPKQEKEQEVAVPVNMSPQALNISDILGKVISSVSAMSTKYNILMEQFLKLEVELKKLKEQKQKQKPKV